MDNLGPIIDAPGFKVDGSESMDEVAARVSPALLSLRDEFPGEILLLISHAGVMISQGLDHRVINQVDVRKDQAGENQLVKLYPE
jgi:broad specificity phosphatase PhoE